MDGRPQDPETISTVTGEVETEIGGNALCLSTDIFDNHYKIQMVCKISNFAKARAYLVPNESITQFYSML